MEHAAIVSHELEPECREFNDCRDVNGNEGRDEPLQQQGRRQNAIRSTSLFDKLGMLEKKWQSQIHSEKGAWSPRMLSVTTSAEQKKSVLFPARVVSPFDRLYQHEHNEQAEQKTPAPPSPILATVSSIDLIYQKGSIDKSVQQAKACNPKQRSRRRQRAATKIQCVFRALRVQKELQILVEAAREIQKWWQHMQLRAYYLQLRESVPVVQSMERRRAAVHKFCMLKHAVLVLQGKWRIKTAKDTRRRLVSDLERRACESNASALIQRMLLKHQSVIRHQHLECNSLMLDGCSSGEVNNDTETDAVEMRFSEATTSLVSAHADAVPSSEIITYAEDTTSPSVASCNEGPKEKLCLSTTEPETIASGPLYRAAHLRRRAQKKQEVPLEDATRDKLRSKSHSASTSRQYQSTKSAASSIVSNYLPAKKKYYHYDLQKLQLIPSLQRWARKQLEFKANNRASVKIQSAWRVYRAHSHLISKHLIRQWSVRVDFHQGGTTSDPLLRQRVRLLALTNAIQQVANHSIPQYVSVTHYTFSVNWVTNATIYFGEGLGVGNITRCSIHVLCEAHRHRLCTLWSSHKKFSLLSKTALLKSFKNQCARLNEASVLLQSSKMKQIMAQISHELAAATVIQCFWRHCNACRPAKQGLKIVKISAVKVQSWWRMIQCLDQMEEREASAFTIQAWFRAMVLRRCMWKSREFYRELTLLKLKREALRRIQLERLREASAVRLQAAWRMIMSRNSFVEKVWATYVIQAAYKRHMIQISAHRATAAMQIETVWRMYSCRSVFLRKNSAICNIQSAYRSYVARRNLQAKRDFSATVMQKVIRGRKARRNYEVMLTQHFAASVIQTAWGKYNDKKAAALLLSIILIQKHVRLFHGEKMAAATLIQTHVRSRQARQVAMSKQIAKIAHAATVIQCFYRKFAARCLFLQLAAERHTHQAQMAIQDRIMNGYKRYNSTESAASMSIRDCCSSESMGPHQYYKLYSINMSPGDKIDICAFFIQISYKTYICRKNFLIARAAAVTIQQNWRAYSWRPDNHCVRAIVDEECIEVERTARPVKPLLTKRLRIIAAVLVQAWWRAKIERKKYYSTKAQKKSANTLSTGSGNGEPASKPSQETVASYFFLFSLPHIIPGWNTAPDKNTIPRTKKVVDATIQIQRWWRARQETPVVSELVLSKVQSSDVEFPVTRKQYLRQMRNIMNSVCLLQKHWRRKLVCIYAFRHSMAFLIQSRVRVMLQQNDLAHMKNGFHLFQLKWRKYSRSPKFLECIGRRNKGLCLFQSLVKYHHIRRKKVKAATILQCKWRMVARKTAYLRQRKLATRLQMRWRRHQLQCRIMFAVKTRCATVLQRRWRVYHSRKRYGQKRYASIIFQKIFRRFSSKLAYDRTRKGFIVLQQLARGGFHSKTQAAIILQKQHRLWSALKTFRVARSAAIHIQKPWRKSLCQSHYSKMRRGFKSLQAQAKREFSTKMAAAKFIQTSTRMMLGKSMYKQHRHATIALQSQWRRHFFQRKLAIQLQGFAILQAKAKRLLSLKASAVTVLQRQWRMVIARVAFQTCRAGSIQIQKQYRKVLDRSAYVRMVTGFTTLQSFAKLWFRIKDTCAVKLQAAARRAADRRRFLAQLLATIKVQSAFRAYIQRRNFSVLCWLRSIAATMIASWWRKIMCEAQYYRVIHSITQIQWAFRSRRQEFASVQIQALLRRCVTRKKFKCVLKSTSTIQHAARTFLEKHRLQVRSAVIIQRAYLVSQERFAQRCLKVLERFRAVDEEHKMLLASYQRDHFSSEAANNNKLAVDASISLQRAKYEQQHQHQRQQRRRQQQDNHNSCNPLSLMCNFDLGLLSPNDLVTPSIPSIVMPWDNTSMVLDYIESDVVSLDQHEAGVMLQIQAAIRIQRFWRGKRVRQSDRDRYFQAIAAAWIQCIWRGYQARKRYQEGRRQQALIDDAFRSRRSSDSF